jgi:molybdopterin molybdotransferase
MKDEHDPNLLSFEDALQRIADAVQPITAQRCVSLREALDGITAQDVRAPMHVPPFVNSAMDGYAINSANLPTRGETRLRVLGKSFAGKPFAGALKPGECVRIMTGAVVPDGADTIIMQEHAKVDGDYIVISAGHTNGQHVRHPGDDFSTGDTIIHAGERLTPAKLGLLASTGVTELQILRKPVVAFFSTGDELKGVGQTLNPGDIYDSNRYILFGMLKKLGVDFLDMGVIADVKPDIEHTLQQAASCADVIITSGGASVGEADFIKQILDDIGAVNFWKIAMKPGKPLAFGKIGNKLFFGLPGNPVSAMATFYLFVQPALRLLEGEKTGPAIQLKARCSSLLKKQPGRKDFQRGMLHVNEQGELLVETTGVQGSHMLSSMAKANCFIVLPREAGNVEAGSEVDVMLFNGLI